jgi:chemotaxis protein MotB
VKAATQPLIDNHQIALHRTKYWLEIEIRTDILFSSGMARLQPAATPILERVAAVLAPYHNPLRVEGFTDNRPIRTSTFPSNWELSAARAATVARLFSDHGVDPDRLGILGWSQYRPLASNATAAGRNRNRRVTILVLSDRGVPARFYSDARRVPDAAPSSGKNVPSHESPMK